MFNFDDPGIAFAFLAIIVGLRLALYVADRLLVPHTTEPVQAMLSPDDVPEDTAPLAPNAVDHKTTTADPHPYRFATELLDSAFIAVILVFFLLRPFVLQAFYIPSESMVPTLQHNDKLLATKFTYRLREPRRGEIVVFHAPKLALEASRQPYDPSRPTDYVKRVIGLPGEHVRIVSDDGVYINGRRLTERYVAALPNYNFPAEIQMPETEALLHRYIHHGELVVPKGYLFVLGDNRQVSSDGHIWGLLPRKALVGKALFIFWPLDRAGLVH